MKTSNIAATTPSGPENGPSFVDTHDEPRLE
ncbi:hypothetical protein FOWG_12750 [Fusarium oxysporum f. sp. lycopersici MN25]|uniref:Uncharacterized protein n=1 Tax=Fusarium oxysporum Fo47 TaxID=660027 RepID=W9KB53_FUSOX|nr:hypothetical protein FOZG_08355 [Fusarium oxysporum Fo47]EWZ83856.1 hypothetical protein FOWG_12750 [Fusarium oxysporum f. sp. lycopersici MN25]